MTPTLRLPALALVLVFAASAQAAKKAPKKPEQATAGKVDVELSHSFGPTAEVELQKLVDRFNEKFPTLPIKLVRQQADGKPTLLNILRRTQVAEFVAGKHGFKPLHGVIKEAGEKVDFAGLSRDLKAGVADEKGRMLALPVGYSTPVLFYNKNAFRKAKLDPEQPPKTWQEVQAMSAKLLEAGFQCPYTTSWPTWVHIDNLSALAGVPVATPKGEFVFNGLVQVKHLAKLSTWKAAGMFRVFGRKNEADDKFKDGNCVMLTTDSWAHTEFREAQGVELGVAPLPHDEDNYGGRQHTLADGSSLWIGSGFKPADYKAAAKFVSFLLTPEIQVQLASIYGQLPLTEASRAAIKSKALRDRSQTLEVAYAQLKGSGASHPLRVSAVDPVRQIVDEELEKVWAGTTPPKAALDTAVVRGNAILKAQPVLKKATPF